MWQHMATASESFIVHTAAPSSLARGCCLFCLAVRLPCPPFALAETLRSSGTPGPGNARDSSRPVRPLELVLRHSLGTSRRASRWWRRRSGGRIRLGSSKSRRPVASEEFRAPGVRMRCPCGTMPGAGCTTFAAEVPLRPSRPPEVRPSGPQRGSRFAACSSPRGSRVPTTSRSTTARSDPARADGLPVALATVPPDPGNSGSPHFVPWRRAGFWCPNGGSSSLRRGRRRERRVRLPGARS